MAKIGTAEVASRFDGLATGPSMAYVFETQEGLPVDGTNSLLRDYSPFVLRILPPDALLNASVTDGETNQVDQSASVDLITAAASSSRTSDQANSLANALSNVSAFGADTTALTNIIANGEFQVGQGTGSSTLADVLVATDIALQLQAISKVPPLTLLVNPNTMTISYTKIQNFGTRTRYGYVFEAWGEEQPSISFGGSTAGFVAGVASSNLGVAGINPGSSVAAVGAVSGENISVSGYQDASRRDSAAWQNFVALYQFYRNNGYIYDLVGKSEAHHFIGTVAIDYDQWTYVGHFENFSFNFSEASPHRVEFSAEFKVDRMYDWAEPSYAPLPQDSPTPDNSWDSVASAATGIAGATSRAANNIAESSGDLGSVNFDLLI